MANTVTVQILADVRNMVNGVNQTNTHLQGLNDRVGRVTGALKGMVAGFAALGAANLLGDTISAASDLQETLNKSDTVFGENASAMRSWAQNAATSFGLSRQEALSGAATFGNFFDQIGIGGQQAVAMSQGFVQMASDLGSFHNAAPVDVMNALQSATRGEFDALQQFIPTINAAAVQAEAFAQTGKTSADSLTEAEKAAALYTLATEGLGAAQGDFGRTSDGLANRQRILAAKFEDVKATIGSALLPAMSALAGFVLDKVIPAAKSMAQWFSDNVVPALKDLWRTIQANVLPVLQAVGQFIMRTIVPALTSMAQFIAENSSLFLGIAAVVGTFLGVLAVYNGLVTTVMAITRAWAAVQLAFNLIMMVNPFVLIIAAIAALVVAVIYAWNNFEGFRDIIIGVWEAVKNFVVSAAEFLVNLFLNWTLVGIIINHWETIKNAAVTIWNAILNFIRGIPGAITGFFGAIAGWFSSTFQSIKNGIVTAFNNAVAFVQGIPGAIIGVFGGAVNWLSSAGRNILEGLWNGIRGAVGWITNKLRDFVSGIKDSILGFFGIHSPSRMFMEIGGYLTQGLAKGITDPRMVRLATRATESLGASVANAWSDPALAVGFAGGGGAGSGGVNITINAGMGTDPYELENAVARAVQGYSNRNGSGWVSRL